MKVICICNLTSVFKIYSKYTCEINEELLYLYMDCEIKDILLELQDEMFNVRYDKNHIFITAPFKFKLKNVIEVLQRLFYYTDKKASIYIETKDRILGAIDYVSAETRFLYKIETDDTLFDSFYTKRIRGNKIPLYIRTKTEIKGILIVT